ncbi:PREDICTED: sialic acid-binding Ig-like lectin 6-like [Elephantulus edwardii]|uniref:sialic acid-binding Ig-like lectin 6-like n=1 Tax=Elephantulus edwardii TaxID=28737 RepID=UPI0003F0BC25|nr:PREDICTED: sialic acid-binding Ig-like lectin 6-like [Elephantulus edwardii]
MTKRATLAKWKGNYATKLKVICFQQSYHYNITENTEIALKLVVNTSSLTIPEGQSMHLHCTADSNPPPRLACFQGSST